MSDPMTQPHVMFDIETLSTEKNAVVISVGLTAFNFASLLEFDGYVANGLHLKLDVSEQDKRHRSRSTMDWWADQGPDASRVLSPMPTDLSFEAFSELVLSWMVNNAVNDDSSWYCRGPHFDAAILEDLYGDFRTATPFHYGAVRDSRTFFDHFEKEKLEPPENMIPHNGLHDAAWEAHQMVYWSFQ